MTNRTFINSITALALMALVLSGVHSKDLVIPLIHSLDVTKQANDIQAQISTELHHHGDSTVKIQAVSDGHLADSRSLRLLSRHKLHPSNRFTNRLLRWWHHTLQLS